MIDFYNKYPLRSTLISASIVLLIATFFSEGYGMHDDHFLIIETASSWANGYDYNRWLPWNQLNEEVIAPKGHSLTYTGFIYLLFEAMQAVGIENPKVQMIFIRLFQSILWLIAISTAFKISKKLSNVWVAKRVSLLLAIGALIPFLAVRNLVEMTCVPFLLLGIWNTIKSEKWTHFLLAGLFFGLAFSVRFQVALFIAFYGFMMIFKFKFKHCIWTLLGILISIGLTQGLVDYLIWGRPLAEFWEYVAYNNSDHKYDYAKNMGGIGYATYILILANLSVPVIGFFYWFGSFYNWRKLFFLLIPLLVFVAFHSYYPNRQERFIFPMIPIFLITGISGWYAFREKSKFWIARPKLWNKISRPFIILSLAIGFASAFIATRKSRMDSMYYLYGKDVKYVFAESITGDNPMMPKFYAKNWDFKGYNVKTETLDKYNVEPDYIFFYGEKKLSLRIDAVLEKYPNAKLVETCYPSWFDRMLFFINPRGNKNEVIEIYQVQP